MKIQLNFKSFMVFQNFILITKVYREAYNFMLVMEFIQSKVLGEVKLCYEKNYNVFLQK